MKQLLKCIIFFAFISSAVSLDFGRFLGFQRAAREDEAPKDPEIPEVVETVRWRQSVCVVPGANVPPCFPSLKKYQNEHEKNSERRIDENSGELKSEEKLDRKTGRALSLERDDRDVSRIITPKVMRLMEIENLPSDQVQSSNNEENLHLNIRSATPGLEVAYGQRQGKYIIIATASPSASPSTPPPAISVTKVLNSPVTATLVAKNCFPDIGVPLCNDYQETLTIYKKPKIDRKRYWVEKSHRHREHHSHNHEHEHRSHERDSQTDENEDSFLHNSQILLDRIKQMSSFSSPSSQHDSTIITQSQLKPQVLTVVESHGIQETPTTPRPNTIIGFPSLFAMNFFQKKNNTNVPGLQQVVTQSIQTAGSLLYGSAEGTAVQAVQGVLNQSHVGVADKNPETQSVVVLENEQKPGFFANIWGPGGFNIFNKIMIYDSTTSKPVNYDNENVRSKSSPTANPEETKVTEFFNNPQSDHSVASSQDEPTTIASCCNTNVTQLDQPSGSFDNLTESSNKTDKEEKSSLLVKNSQNKPLVVERPGQSPLLIERPIYVSEKPALAILFNFVRPSKDQPLLNVDHKVIKDVVYVFEKPTSPTSGLQAWFSIIEDELMRDKKNETASVQMGNAEEVIVDSTDKEPETIVQASTTPETISTVVEDSTTTEIPAVTEVPEVFEVAEENITAVSEVETSTETETTIVEIVETVATEVPTVPEVTEVTEENETSMETETISTDKIDWETPEVTTLPYAGETTTTIVTTDASEVPEVTELTTALEESSPEVATSESHVTNLPVTQQLVNTTPESTTILEALEETATTEMFTEVTEKEYTEATEASTYPEVPEESWTTPRVVSELRRLKKRDVSLPIIDEILTGQMENWSIPEDVELFNPESEFIAELGFSEEPQTSQSGSEEITNGATETISTDEIDRETPKVTTLPYAEETTTTIVTTDASEVPEVTELTTALEESSPEVAASESHVTNLPVTQQLVDTTPESTTILEALEETATTEMFTEVTENEYTEATEASTYPEVLEESWTTPHDVSELRRLKKGDVSLPIIDKILTSPKENWTIPEDVELFNPESEFIPELVSSEEPQTSQSGSEEETNGATETYVMPEIFEVFTEGSGYSPEVEFSQSTAGTEDVDVAEKEKTESVPEIDALEETETPTITAEEIDTPTPQISTTPQDPTTPEIPSTLVDETVDTTQQTAIIPEVVKAAETETENVSEVESSEFPKCQTSQEADKSSEENRDDSMEKCDTETAAVLAVPEDAGESSEEKTEWIPRMRFNKFPQIYESFTGNERFLSISARNMQRLRFFSGNRRNQTPNPKREVSVREKRDVDKVEVSTVPEYVLRAEETAARFANTKKPKQPAYQPYIKLPRGFEFMESMREHETSHVFVPKSEMSQQLAQETTTVVQEVETTTQSVQTVPEEIEVPEERIEFVGEVDDARNATTSATLIETRVTETTELPVAPETIIVPEADEHPETSTILDYDGFKTTRIPSEAAAESREQEETSQRFVEEIVNQWIVNKF